MDALRRGSELPCYERARLSTEIRADPGLMGEAMASKSPEPIARHRHLIRELRDNLSRHIQVVGNPKGSKQVQVDREALIDAAGRHAAVETVVPLHVDG